MHGIYFNLLANVHLVWCCCARRTTTRPRIRQFEIAAQLIGIMMAQFCPVPEFPLALLNSLLGARPMCSTREVIVQPAGL